MSDDEKRSTGLPVADTKSPEVKGTGFLGILRTLRAELSAADFATLREHVPADTRQLMDHPPSAVAWLPTQCQQDLLETALSKVYMNNETAVVELGKKAFGSDLNSIYKVFIRIATPEFVADRASKIWDTYNRNNGTLVTLKPQDKTVELVYSGLYRSSPAYWAYQRGAIAAAVEATGVKSFSVTCVEGGGLQTRAVYRVTWS